MLRDAAAHLLVNGLYDVVAAVLLQRTAQSIVEQNLLFLGRHGRVYVKQCVNDVLVYLVGIFAVKKSVVYIR